MKVVGVTEAKKNWSELLDRVERGETITITRNGVPAGMLVPVAEDEIAPPVKQD